MIEPSDELLQKAIVAACEATGRGAYESDLDWARENLRYAKTGRRAQITRWGWVVIGYVAAHKDMEKDNV